MANNDIMLNSFRSTGLVRLGDKWYSMRELVEEATALQNKAMQAKLAGDHKTAVQLYRELIPYLSKLDALGTFGGLSGLPVQIAKRTIEQLEEVA